MWECAEGHVGQGIADCQLVNLYPSSIHAKQMPDGQSLSTSLYGAEAIVGVATGLPIPADYQREFAVLAAAVQPVP